MAAAQNHHTLLKVGGAVAAAAGAYEFLYKPWKASQDAALLAAGLPSTSPVGGGGGGGIGFSLPYIAAPTNVSGIAPSNLDPGAAIGGPTGTCMHRKGWTQTQCETRLNALVSAYQSTTATLQQLNSGTELATVNAAIAANKAGLASAMTAYNQATAAGDVAGANQWKLAIDGHNADIAALTAAAAAIPAKITALQNNVAGFIHDYQALTGLTLG